jgi:hypothetical protein
MSLLIVRRSLVAILIALTLLLIANIAKKMTLYFIRHAWTVSV